MTNELLARWAHLTWWTPTGFRTCQGAEFSPGPIDHTGRYIDWHGGDEDEKQIVLDWFDDKAAGELFTPLVVVSATGSKKPSSFSVSQA